MQSDQNKDAETVFREAYLRLKKNNPIRLKKGSLVSQNNVAREAGKDPSGLRFERYPELIQEIQAYVQSHKEAKQRERISPRNKTRKLRERLADCESQRDRLASICHAQQEIIETLEAEIAELKEGNVVEFNRGRSL